MYNNYNYTLRIAVMFGYIKTDKGELKVKEYELYRGLYCSLCKHLGKNYGVFSRLILSYDMTFLVLVRLCEKGISPNFKGGRCPFNPAKRCNYCTNADEEYDFVCAAAILMFYYKVKDNIEDSGFFKKLFFFLLLPFAFFKRKKAKRLFPNLDSIIRDSIEKQRETEKTNTDSLDKAAHASADALGKIFSLGFEEKERELYRFGYFVGRWVYLVDAADDIESDLKSHSFNVFVNRFSLSSGELSKEALKEIEGTLNVSSAQALEALKKTDCKISTSIIENILEGGMLCTARNVLKGTKINERSL